MIKLDENSLICDLAETYHIYNYKQLPPATVAVFSIGLRENSRIKMKLSGQKASTETLILVSILDRLNIITWLKTKDGSKGINKPKSILESFYTAEKEIKGFTSGKEYEEERNRIIERG